MLRVLFGLPTSLNCSTICFGLAAGACIWVLVDGVWFSLALRQASWHIKKTSELTFRLPKVFYIGTPEFFGDPYRFLRQWTELGQGRWFWFKVRNDHVLAVSGDEARKVLVTNRNLSAVLGYSLLNPSVRAILPGKPDESPIAFNWFFKTVLRTDVIGSFLGPILLEVKGELDTWGNEGIMDPFVQLRRVILVAVLRFIVGDEVFQDPGKVNEIIEAYRCVDEASTPDSLLFPWLPTPSRLRRLFAGIKLFNISLEAVRLRRKRRNKSLHDVLQTILDDEEHNVDDKAAARLLIGAIFAAGGSSSMIYPWMHLWLAQEPILKARAQKEVDDFIRKQSSGKFLGFEQDLIDVPIGVWEDNLQIFDLSLREALRLAMINVVPRNNAGDDLKIGHEIIRNGDFVLYMLEEVHFDPLIYPEPGTFDPFRSYDHNRDYTFLGWGAGPHTCIGQRLAKLVVKLTSALVLAHFTLEPVDNNGNPVKTMPEPKGRLFGIGCSKQSVFFKYKRRNLKESFT